jgi:hypothetical protein
VGGTVVKEAESLLGIPGEIIFREGLKKFLVSKVDGKLYRFDNAPHHVEVSTFPHHFHDGSEEKVTDSWISPNLEKAIYQVMDFVRNKVSSRK